MTPPPVYTSPSNSLPATHTEAVQAGSMVMPPMVTPPMEVTLSLTAAPAAFARPIRINKHLSPSFRVGITCLLTLSPKAKTLGVFNTSCSANLLDVCGADYLRMAY